LPLVDQWLVSSEQPVHDRFHPGPVVPGEPSRGPQDDEAVVELDRACREEEIGGLIVATTWTCSKGYRHMDGGWRGQ